MKTRRRARLLAVLAAASLAAAAEVGCSSAPPSGARWESVETKTMPSPVHVLVVVPPSYDREPARRYPVLYFLHDGYGDGKTLARRGVAAEALARMRDGRLPEFFIVAPDGPGHLVRRLLRRQAPLRPSSSTEDLPRWIGGALPRRCRARASRGITGISMGGYGAVKLALDASGSLRVGLRALGRDHPLRLGRRSSATAGSRATP